MNFFPVRSFSDEDSVVWEKCCFAVKCLLLSYDIFNKMQIKIDVQVHYHVVQPFRQRS